MTPPSKTPSDDASQSRLAAWLDALRGMQARIANIRKELWGPSARTDKNEQKDEESQQQQQQHRHSRSPNENRPNPAGSAAASLPTDASPFVRLAPGQPRKTVVTQTLVTLPQSNIVVAAGGVTTRETCRATPPAASKIISGVPRAVDDVSYLDGLFDLCETRSSNDGDSDRE